MTISVAGGVVDGGVLVAAEEEGGAVISQECGTNLILDIDDADREIVARMPEVSRYVVNPGGGADRYSWARQ